MGNRIRLEKLWKRLTMGKKRRRLERIERRAEDYKRRHAIILEKLGVKND